MIKAFGADSNAKNRGAQDAKLGAEELLFCDCYRAFCAYDCEGPLVAVYIGCFI